MEFVYIIRTTEKDKPTVYKLAFSEEEAKTTYIAAFEAAKYAIASGASVVCFKVHFCDFKDELEQLYKISYIVESDGEPVLL